MNYSIWSHNFIYDDTDFSTCNVNIDEWRRIQDENVGINRLFAQVTLGEKKVYIALGTPIGAEVIPNSLHKPLFLPGWVLDILCCEGAGETVEVDWLDSESFPEATRIVLRPHDSAFFHADAKEELERALTSIGVLQLGTTIPVTLAALGGFTVYVDVVGLEPTTLVLMQGDEVAIEFEEALDAPAAAPPPPPTPEPKQEVLVTPPAPVAQGHQLGGVSRPRGPDGRAWNPWRT